MSEGNDSGTEDLAHLLWEKQGRPESPTAQNWLESEYLAHSLVTVSRDENEADLRMRGLGPLTQDGSPPRTNDEAQKENNLGTSKIEKPDERGGAISVIASCVAGTAMVIGVGMLFSIFRKRG